MFHSSNNGPGDWEFVGSAQVLAAAALEAIGKIRTAIGSVTVMRADGGIVQISVGDFVYQGDTIESAADGAVGIHFIDGTEFNLSAGRLVLNEFVCDLTGALHSALLSLIQGAFTFIAGKVANTGGLRIDTPFASIRDTAQDRGIGLLTLAALTFAAIKESQAASRHDAFLDDGIITYKDLAHGTFEILTRDGRVIVADDPGETIIVDPTGAVTRIPNSSSRMAELQDAQQSALATLSLGQQGGAPGGSSSPSFDIPSQLQPINFIRAENAAAAAEHVTVNITPTSSGVIEAPQFKAPPAVVPVAVVTPALAPDAGLHAIGEVINTTGSTILHTIPAGTLTFTDFHLTTVSASVASITWSGGSTPPSGLAAVLADALSITTDAAPNSGSIAATFSAADYNFDFIAANETLTVVYNVMVTDNNGVSLTQPVTITIAGTNDAPVLALDASARHTVTEGFNTTGRLAFTDVDINDHHTVSTTVASAIWSGGATLPSGLSTVLAGALSTTRTDSTGSGSGSIAFTFSSADDHLHFLAAGQSLTVIYNVTVTDDNGASSTQPVTISLTGSNHAPAITSGPAAVAVSEEGLPRGIPDPLPAILDTTDSPTATGTIAASDADGDQLTMTLGAPIAPLTSGGVLIAWTLQDTGHTLIGKAGATPIITATITDAGGYIVTLTGPIDHPVAGQEDVKTFTVPVTVSDGETTTPTTLSVTVEDDSPKAEPVEVSVVQTDSKTNVMLILDLSGSMDISSGVAGLTRLDVAKAAINELLDQYDNRGDVMVRVVTFSDTGAALGSVWMSAADAKAAIAGLSAGGTTNYDAALLTAMEAFTDGTKLTGPGTQNVSYFLSDGDPTANSDWPQISGTQLADGIQPNEQAVWESFLSTNNIISFALGIPNVGAPANLDPIAFDPALGTQLADTPIIITDLTQLAKTLVFTIPPITGSVLTGAGGATSNSFGADGGYVQSITVGDITYTFDPAANGGAGGVTANGGGSFSYDATTKTLTVDTDSSGELAMVMTTGAFTFQPPKGFISESVSFVLVDRDGDTANSMLRVTLSNLTTLIPSHILPAGVAGSPINLGLTEPADHVGPVTVTIAGVPYGWTLSDGANNGDGSWTIQASNLSTLSITPPDKHAGAMAFQVTMTWTNADGSSAFARVTDNVEVFAQGAPIVAWSGDDHLTGSSGKDLFVVARPIGHDTIYSFNASEDQIDLIGYAGFVSFDDVKSHLTADANGDAVITLADGQSITLFRVPVSPLSASNFVFDHTPALSNAGTITVNDGAVLPLSGIITNTGTIALDSAGNETHVELIQSGITLQGGGRVMLSDSSENLISGTAPSVTLANIDNTISGAGHLGGGQVTLTNNGTIIAVGTHALVIDAGPNVVTNGGTLEAVANGGLIVNSDIANSGLIWANGGNITINGAVTGAGSAMISGTATLEFGAASSANIAFKADAAGTLILRDPADFTGTISGLSSTNHIDLANISYEIASVYSITYRVSTNMTTLVITDGTNTDTIDLLGNYTIDRTWQFSDDGHGGAVVSDPPVLATSEDIPVQSASADNDLIVKSPLTSLFQTNLDNRTITDPQTNFVYIDNNHPAQHPADNLLHLPTPLDGNSGLSVTEGAQTAHLRFDVTQLANFKFADDSSAHPGDAHTLPLTPLASDLSGDQEPAALALASNVAGTVLAPATSEQAGTSDTFIFGKSFVHNMIADLKPDMPKIDHSMLADIQHLLDTERYADAVSTLDPHHQVTLPDMTKVQLPHHMGDFDFA